MNRLDLEAADSDVLAQDIHAVSPPTDSSANRKRDVELVCMYGFDTTLAEDVERSQFLRSLPGAYVFVQEYLPIRGGPTPMLENFFDDNADQLLDELTKVIFTQNMKSMEKYYRWVSKLYARRFGKLHMKLVDTLFRYNRRENKGRYIQTLAGTRSKQGLEP